MYLKCLDLYGFKSFPEKVKLEFNKGITTVVGPNGSGKSNISDSVRWVLGEQRAKSLRGEKMEDIIFAGTQNRRPLGMAEVSITIDNSDGKMPIEYTEVTVTRRVFRSGESDYLINGSQCRLKDIQELFMDTGVGREGYSIIGQGKIDEILSTKSEDRRRLFEEAAGIVKYKNRKIEAISKLEKEKQNLERVEDIIGELELKIEPLAQQSEKAKAYLGYKEELKQLDINYFKLRVDKIDEELKKIEYNIEILKNDLNDKNKAQDSKKQKISNIKLQIEEISEKLQSFNERISSIRTEIEKKQGEIKLTKEQIQNLELNINRLENEIDQKNVSINDKTQEINIHKTKLNAVDLSLSSEKTKLLNEETEFSKLSNILVENEEYIEEYKSQLIEKIKKTTNIKGNFSRNNAMLDQFKNRKEQITSEKAYILSQINNNNVHINAQEKKNEQYLEARKDLEVYKNKLQCDKQEILNKIENEKKRIDHKTRVYNECQSKLKVLSDMEKSHEGFFRSVKEILTRKANGDKTFDGVYGAVGELIIVDKKLEVAIEIALGSAVQNLITKTEDDAKKAIEFLKRNNMGRATFLPISAIRGKTFGNERNKIISEKGVVGIAKDLIEYDTEFDGVISSLLGKVIIMDSMENAITLSKRHNQSYKIVTLDGEILNPGGSMTGGSIAKKSSNLFGRSREINELKESIIVIKKEIEEFKSNLLLFEDEKNKIDEKSDYFTTKDTELHYQIISAKDDIEKSKVLINEHKNKLELYIIEEKQLDEQIADVEKSSIEFEETLNHLQLEIEQLDNKVSSYQADLQSEKDIREEMLSNITNIKINITNFEQIRISSCDNIKRLENEIKTLKKEISDKVVDINNNKELVLKKKNDIEIIEKNIENDYIVLKSSEEELILLSEQRRNNQKEVIQLEEKQSQILDIISQLKNDIFKVETKKEKFEDEKQRLFDEIWEEYEITYQGAKEFLINDLPESQLVLRLKNIKLSIKELGNINVNAIEEYKEVKERYEFLSEQKNDIIKAEESLIKIIQELSSLMEQQFQEQFNIISENFNVVFSEMFGGGKAYLKLSDEDNILESGIEIIAQPPGKNLQNMTLLSGGERALTAVAILFAILKMKPSPFCILDEIEAALDDANVKRFANYLKKFAGNNQFIVITHRKGTMEAADVMYGVTMQEQGVSKIVSVSFEDSQKLAQ